MKKLYSMEAAGAWKKKARLWKYLMLLTGAAALAVCIFLCTKVDGMNADRLLLPVIAISVLAGWAVMLLYVYAFHPARARAEHMLGVMAGEEEMFAGVLKRTGETFAIPKSVTVKKMTLTDGENKMLFHADSAVARQLPPDGTKVRLCTVRKFITGYEVIQ